MKRQWDLADVQEEIASQITSSAGLLRSWSHRREKRQAATTPPRPSVAQLASAQDDSDSDSDSRQPGRPDDLEELPTLKVPCINCSLRDSGWELLNVLYCSVRDMM